MEPYVHLLRTKARLCWIWKADGMLGPGVLPPSLPEAQAPFHAGSEFRVWFSFRSFSGRVECDLHDVLFWLDSFLHSSCRPDLWLVLKYLLLSLNAITLSMGQSLHPLNTPSSFPTLHFLGLASTPPSPWALPPSSLSSPFNISFAKLLKTWAHTMSPGIQAILRVSVIHDSTAHLRTQIDKERPKLVSKDRLLFFYGYLLSHFSLSQTLSQSITWLYLNYMIFCNLCI